MLFCSAPCLLFLLFFLYQIFFLSHSNYFFLFSFFIPAIGLPLSYVLAFQYNMGVIGLCIGTTIGTFVHMALYMLILARTNWAKESDKVQYALRKEAFRRKYPTAKYVDDNKWVVYIMILCFWWWNNIGNNNNYYYYQYNHILLLYPLLIAIIPPTYRNYPISQYSEIFILPCFQYFFFGKNSHFCFFLYSVVSF